MSLGLNRAFYLKIRKYLMVLIVFLREKIILFIIAFLILKANKVFFSGFFG